MPVVARKNMVCHFNQSYFS